MKAVLGKDREPSTDLTTLPKGLTFCDNMGVVNHGSAPNKTLSEKQVQADILGHMKYLLRHLAALFKFAHVRGHIDRVLSARNRNFQQNLQVEMDKKATSALTKVVADDVGYITTLFPFKRVIMLCGNSRVTASATDAIYEWTSRETARALYDERNIVPAEYFDLIYWKGFGKVMTTRFNSSFATFYSKHLIRCCGV